MKTSPIRKDLFGFTSTPFLKITQHPYLDDTRKEALDKLYVFLEYRGFAVVTGDNGCGKTMLLDYLCKNLNPNSCKIIYIPFAFFNENDMLSAICHGLDIDNAYRKEMMIHDIHNRIHEIHPINPILILDEIQQINQQTLETVRLLCNFQFDSKNHFSFIMSGADSFLERLRRQVNEPLRQRITLFVNLKPLGRDQTGEYLSSYTQAAGAHQQVFTDQAVAQIHDAANGIPRVINNIAVNALHLASIDQSTTVELDHVHQAMKSTLIPQREIKL